MKKNGKGIKPRKPIYLSELPENAKIYVIDTNIVRHGDKKFINKALKVGRPDLKQKVFYVSNEGVYGEILDQTNKKREITGFRRNFAELIIPVKFRDNGILDEILTKVKETGEAVYLENHEKYEKRDKDMLSPADEEFIGISKVVKDNFENYGYISNDNLINDTIGQMSQIGVF